MDELISRQAAIDNLISFLQLDGEYARGIRECLNALPSVQLEPRWVSVTEWLPEYGESVLCYYEDDDYGVNRIIDDEDGEWLIDGVVAWMPLPEPYRKETEDA